MHNLSINLGRKLLSFYRKESKQYEKYESTLVASYPNY